MNISEFSETTSLKPPHRNHLTEATLQPHHRHHSTEKSSPKPLHWNHVTATTSLKPPRCRTSLTPLPWKKTITGTAPPKPQHCKHITEVTKSAQPHHFTEATSAQLLHWRHSIYDITDWHRLFKKNRWNCSTDTISLQPHPWNHWTETTSPQPLDWNPFTETIRTAICSFWWMFLTEISLSPLQFAVLKYDSMSLTKFQFHNFDLQFLKNVSHKTFIFTSSTCSFGRMSRTKVSLSHLHLAVFEGCPSQKFRFHMFDLQFLKDVRHESFVCTTSTCSLLKDVSHESFFLASSSCSSWRTSRTNSSFV